MAGRDVFSGPRERAGRRWPGEFRARRTGPGGVRVRAGAREQGGGMRVGVAFANRDDLPLVSCHRRRGDDGATWLLARPWRPEALRGCRGGLVGPHKTVLGRPGRRGSRRANRQPYRVGPFGTCASALGRALTCLQAGFAPLPSAKARAPYRRHGNAVRGRRSCPLAP